MNHEGLIWARIRSEMGPISVGWGSRGLSRVLLNESYSPAHGANREFQEFLQLLERYLSGEKIDFKQVRRDLSCHTPFRQKVLCACATIPYGEVTTYGDLAKEVGSPYAARAVGQTMAHNTLPIVVPCHRVLASGGPGGFMGRFQGGLEWKRYLLGLEGYSL